VASAHLLDHDLEFTCKKIERGGVREIEVGERQREGRERLVLFSFRNMASGPLNMSCDQRLTPGASWPSSIRGPVARSPAPLVHVDVSSGQTAPPAL